MKVAEIAFIRDLVEDGKRHEAEQEAHRRTAKLAKNRAYLESERARKAGAKAAREAAAEGRRKEVDAAREARIRADAERRRERAEKATATRHSIDAGKVEQAKLKAREREGRIAEVRAAKAADAESAEQLLAKLPDHPAPGLLAHAQPPAAAPSDPSRFAAPSYISTSPCSCLSEAGCFEADGAGTAASRSSLCHSRRTGWSRGSGRAARRRG